MPTKEPAPKTGEPASKAQPAPKNEEPASKAEPTPKKEEPAPWWKDNPAPWKDDPVGSSIPFANTPLPSVPLKWPSKRRRKRERLSRNALLQRGLFPETLPPCYTSEDLKRSLVGLISKLKAKAFHKRPTDYVRYNGTKHDGSRRYFGSPNPISYFYVANFVGENWTAFRTRFASSPFSVSQPKVAADTDDRAIIIPSLSELTTVASKKLGHSAFVLKTDIAQFFPSIYTHAIPWSAHGIEAAKADPSIQSQIIIFNQLDFFIRNCQRAETLGILVGPDAFRLVVEFIAAGIDSEIHAKIGERIVGAARHVDDYYFGLREHSDSSVVLSALRDTLQRYGLNINDAKTKTIDGVEPLNELWAQDLRFDSRRLSTRYPRATTDDIILFINKALSLAKELKSDSPVKIALRTMDQIKAYEGEPWENVEPYLQRIVFHHSHCIDYAALLVVKRVALKQKIDRNGWSKTCYDLLKRNLARNHHHEVVWLSWLLLSANLEISDQLASELSANDNAHVRALVVAAYADGRLARKPPISLGSNLPTTDKNWLLNLVAKATGYSRANFSGSLSEEFDHLSKKEIKLIDFDKHMTAVRKAQVRAISRTRYGYDSDDPDYDEEYDF